MEACPNRAVMPDARRTLYWVARALLESGARLSSLHRAAVYGAPLEAWEGGIAVVDLGEVRGFKRASRALRASSYDALRQAFRRAGATGPRCLRKYHWNVCIAVVGDRELCNFLQGREALVDITYYERFKERSVEAFIAFIAMRPVPEELASGASLSALLRLKYKPAPRRVEYYEEPITGPEAKVLREAFGYSDSEAEAILRFIRNHSDLLG